MFARDSLAWLWLEGVGVRKDKIILHLHHIEVPVLIEVELYAIKATSKRILVLLSDPITCRRVGAPHTCVVSAGSWSSARTNTCALLRVSLDHFAVGVELEVQLVEKTHAILVVSVKHATHTTSSAWRLVCRRSKWQRWQLVTRCAARSGRWDLDLQHVVLRALATKICAASAAGTNRGDERVL